MKIPMKKVFTFRWQDYDINFVKNRSDVLQISMGDYIRRLIREEKKYFDNINNKKGNKNE